MAKKPKTLIDDKQFDDDKEEEEFQQKLADNVKTLQGEPKAEPEQRPLRMRHGFMSRRK